MSRPTAPTAPTAPRRLRQLVNWLPAVVVVPLAMAGAIQVSLPQETGEAIRQLHPLDFGTTWVYAVSDHGKPSGTRTKQIGGQAGLGIDRLDAVSLTSHYTDYPGVGDSSTLVYLGIEKQSLMQYAFYVNHEHLAIDPPAPAYELPLEEGHTWSYKGTVGTTKLTFDAKLEKIEDVEVGGHTFRGCAHFVTHLQYTFANGAGDPETLEEWTCPGYGPVRTTDVSRGSDIDITEELTEFHGTSDDWYAEKPVVDAVEARPGDTFGFDAARTHAVAGTIEPRLAWSDTPAVDFAFPPVADDEVSVLGEEDGEVSAREVTTGEIRWRVRLTGPVVAPPTLAGDTVLVADAGKNLWALGLDDGATHWMRHFGDMVSVSPAVAGTSAVTLAVVATEDGHVTALDLADGGTVWESDLATRTRAAPAISGDRVVVSDPGGEITALDLSTGDQAWSRSLEGGTAVGPAIADGHVLVADNQGVLYSYGVADGDLQWEARTNYDPTGEFAVTDGAFVMLGGDDRIESYDLADGRQRWTLPIEKTRVSPVIVGSQVVSVSDAGKVVVRDLANGDPLDSWRLPLPGPGTSMSVDVPIGLVDGAVVFGANIDAEAHESTLFAYPVTADAERAGVAWDTSVRAVPFPANAAPALSGKTLFVPAQDLVLYRSTSQTQVEPVLKSKGLQPGVVVHGDVVIAQKDDEIQALPVGGGEPLWTFPASQPFTGSIPAVGDDTVFVPEYGIGLAAVSLADGSPRWFTPIDNAVGTMPPLPLPDGDVVYGSGSLARYDGATGQAEWSLPDTQLYANAAYSDGVVFADVIRNQHPSGLVALDADTGRRLWFHPNVLNQILVGPAAGDGVVVYSDTHGLVTAFATAGGAELWHVRLSTPVAGVPVIAGGRVYLSETGREEDLYQRDFRVSAHDLHTGAFLGAFQPPGQGYEITPAVGGTEDGTLLVPATSRLGSIVMILEPRP